MRVMFMIPSSVCDITIKRNRDATQVLECVGLIPFCRSIRARFVATGTSIIRNASNP